MRDVLIGQTDYTVLVKIVGTDGNEVTGLTNSSIDIAYCRVETDNDVTTSDVTPASLSALTDAHSDWGFKEVSSTDHPGLYRLDIADAVFASGAWEAVVTITDASGEDFYAVDIGFRLVNIDPQASVVPANVTQFGGSNGTFSSGRPEVNTSHIAGSAVSTSTAQIGVNVVNFGGSAGTFSSGRPEVNASYWGGTAVASATVRSDLINIAGVAVSTSTAQLGVNVVNFGGSAGTFSSGRPEVNASHISGSSTAADNVEVVYATDFATNYSTSNDQWNVSTSAVASVTGAVGSVTGNVGGNVTGSVGSVASGGITSSSFGAGAITATVIATGAIDADAFAADAVTEIWAGSTAPSAATIADSVWDEALSGHLSAGSTGEALNAAGSAGDPWTTSLPGSYTGSQAGKMLSDILTDTAEIGTAGAGLTAINLPDQTMNITGNITGSLSGSVGSVTGAVGSVTGGVGGSVAGNVNGSVGSVSGNVGGNVVGSVGSVTGNVGGSIGSLATQAKTDVYDQAEAALVAYDPPTRTEATADKDEILTQLPAAPAKNTAFTYVIKMVDATDGMTPETGLTVTMTRSIDGAAFASATGTVTEISTGHYKVAASAADMNGDVVTHRFTASGAADLSIVWKTVS